MFEYPEVMALKGLVLQSFVDDVVELAGDKEGMGAERLFGRISFEIWYISFASELNSLVGVGDDDAEEQDLDGVFKWSNEGKELSHSCVLEKTASPVCIGGDGNGTGCCELFVLYFSMAEYVGVN